MPKRSPLDSKIVFLIDTVLVFAVIASFFFVVGDRAVYEYEKFTHIRTCNDFTSTVLLVNKPEMDSYFSGNGVYIGEGMILTSKHLASRDLQVKSVHGEIEATKVIKVDLHPSLDLAILFLNAPLKIPVANLFVSLGGNTPRTPYSFMTNRDNKVTYIPAGNRYLIESLDQFLVYRKHNGMISFPNNAAAPGDSGSPLIDGNCEVFGLLSGGNARIVFGLRPKSYYVSLIESETRSWLMENYTWAKIAGK